MDQILAAVWKRDRECEQFVQIEIVTCRRRWNRNAPIHANYLILFSSRFESRWSPERPCKRFLRGTSNHNCAPRNSFNEKKMLKPNEMQSGWWFEAHIEISRWPASYFLKNYCHVRYVRSENKGSIFCGTVPTKAKMYQPRHRIESPRGTFAIDTFDLSDLLRFSVFSAFVLVSMQSIRSGGFPLRKVKIDLICCEMLGEIKSSTDRSPVHLWNGIQRRITLPERTLEFHRE